MIKLLLLTYCYHTTMLPTTIIIKYIMIKLINILTYC